MKRFSCLLLLIAIVLLNGNSEQAVIAQSVEPQLVTLWHPYSNEQQALLDELVQQFNTEQSVVAVEAVSFANSALLIDQIILQLINQQNLPNLAMIWPHDAALFDLNDQLVDLQAYNINRDTHWLPTSVGVDPFTEKQIALPHTAFPMTVVVNLDALAELDYSDVPQDWDSFSEAACILRERGGWSGGQFGVAWGITGALEAEAWLALALNNDHSQFSDELYRFDNLSLYETSEQLAILNTDGCLSFEIDRAIAIDTFASGRALFLLTPASTLPIVQTAIQRNYATPFAWTAVQPPMADSALVYTPAISMFRTNADEQGASWQFIEWFLSPDINAQWTAGLGTFPVDTDAYTSLPQLPQRDRVWEGLQANLTITLPTLAGYDVVRLEVRFALERLLTSTTSPEDELPALDALANQITRDFYALPENTP